MRQEAQQKQRRRVKNGSGATISDVSREAGVSTATVSRILNNPEQVSPKTKAVVQSAIEKLGYRPNTAAQSLAARRSYTIGVLVPSISNMLYAIMLDAFKQVIERANYDLMLSSFDYSIDNIRPRVEKFIQRGVDAVFIASVEPDPAVAAILANRDIPFTTTWLADGTAQPRIVYDHLGAAIKPAQHLVELGHRKFALFTGPRARNRRLRERHDAIAGHLLTKGIAPGDITTIEIPVYDLKHAREAFRNMLAKGDKQTAVIASNDIVAAGVILECHARDLSVPEDISVTGFGDMDIAAHFFPPITTIRTPRADVGTLAADYLVARLTGETPRSELLLDFELIVRDTTGPVPTTKGVAEPASTTSDRRLHREGMR